MTTKFSVLLPIHNEASWLPYSLPSVFALDPDEILLMLDRCTDDSEKVARQLASKFRVLHKLSCIEFEKETPDWKTRLAYLRYRGSKLARNDYVLFTSADLVVDPKIKHYLKPMRGTLQFISFWHNDVPFNWSNRLKRLFVSTKLPGLGKSKFLGGIHFFNRKVAWKLENLETLKKVESAEDTHLCMAINTRYISKCILWNKYNGTYCIIFSIYGSYSKDIND